MPITRYNSNDVQSAVERIEFTNNSFGREDAFIYARDNSADSLKELPQKLAKQGFSVYPDIKDGKQVLVVYDFKKPEKLLDVLKSQSVVTSFAKPEIEQLESERNTSNSGMVKFIKRQGLRLAAASGLMGHISMGYLAHVTGDRNFYATAASYASADAIIALYGTDKSVSADPVMQDFKDYLWQQGKDNSFVEARTDKIGFLESTNNFMKKYSFQMANVLGGTGNVGMIMAGSKGSNKDYGMILAGTTSLFGAGLQILGTEEKVNPQQKERKSGFANVLSFINENPMQIAAATNLADPIGLFHSALASKTINQKNIAANAAEILKNKEIILENSRDSVEAVRKYSDARGLKKFAEIAKPYIDAHNKVGNFDFESKSWLKTAANFFEKKEYGSVSQFFDWIDGSMQTTRAKIHQKTGLFGTEKTAEYNAALKAKGELYPLAADNSPFTKDIKTTDPKKSFANETFSTEEELKLAKTKVKIDELERDSRVASKGGDKEPWIRGLVAIFYTGATLLRLVSRKTATVDENRDAFNEVYASAAKSLMNIENAKERDAMTLQMSHFLSMHPKIKEPSDKIVEALTTRVENFRNSPFVQGTQPADNENLPSAAKQTNVEIAAEKTNEQETVAAKAEPKAVIAEAKSDTEIEQKSDSKWTKKSESKKAETLTAMVEENRAKAEAQTEYSQAF